jgi:hypothetical protein
MTVARAGQRSVLLENGEVLVARGASSTGVTATAELYNPSTEHVYGNRQHERCARALESQPAEMRPKVISAARKEMTARGYYENGKEAGHWEFWNDDGSPTGRDEGRFKNAHGERDYDTRSHNLFTNFHPHFRDHLPTPDCVLRTGVPPNVLEKELRWPTGRWESWVPIR